MSATTLFGLVGAALVGLGLYGVILQPPWLRKIVSMNVLSSGIFLLYGIVARRGATADHARDPVPQALVITGIVVAFAGTALAVALLRRWAEVKDGADAATTPAGDGPPPSP